MLTLDLFPHDQYVGILRGVREGGLEFYADLILPYRNKFPDTPLKGQFLLVQLEVPDEVVLGRITSFYSDGKLSIEEGEEFNIFARREERNVPEHLLENYLKYGVNIQVLGVLRKISNGILTFIGSHRRLPRVGSHVAFPSSNILQEIVGHNIYGSAIGHFALGEYIYSYGCIDLEFMNWMQIMEPEVLVKFPINCLVSHLSFILARAGFGKINLIKLLFSELYKETPTIIKAGNRQVPVGTILFDPHGEYFWPDDKGRPGLCDVAYLQDKLVLFTSRKAPSAFYDSFIVEVPKLDIRRFTPSEVMAIALGPEKQDQQHVRKLRELDQNRWEELVNLLDKNGNQTSLKEISKILGLEETQEVEVIAARTNMMSIISTFHDKSSQFMDMLIYALSQGKLCVIDISKMRTSHSFIFSGLILHQILKMNQEQSIKIEPKTIPVITIIEELQSVLMEKTTTTNPYMDWVREGQKYDLGALLISEQLGNIPVDILSGVDNWFIFHFLTSTDITKVHRANARFSEGILNVLLDEPMPHQCLFWSSWGVPYPVSIRILSFEQKFSLFDPTYSMPATATFAHALRAKFQSTPRTQTSDNITIAPQPPRAHAFISYSHKDERYLQELRTHLAPYERSGGVDIWDDTKITPGAIWRNEIEKAIDSAKVAVLLISADFLASDFIAHNELPPLLAAARQEGARILTVILRPCSFNDTVLAQFQTVNTPARPLSEMRRGRRDEVWTKVAQLVRDALKTQN